MQSTYKSERFNMTQAGKDIHLIPKDGIYSNLLIWLHGFGSGPEEYVPILDGSGEFDIVPQKTKIILLSAPIIPITKFGGKTVSSWYNIITDNEIDFNDIIKNSQKIMKIIKNEGKKIGFEHIIVGGFSQGASMSYYLGYNLPFPLGGIIVCSGKLFDEVEILKENHNLKVFIGYGDEDNIIYSSEVEKNIERINNKDCLDVHLYKNIGHQINHDEMVDIGKFMKKIFC